MKVEVYIDSDGSELTVDQNINGRWYYDSKGELHRLDGPAIEWADGDKEWFLHGEYHRLNGPAVEYANGSKYWYQDGKYHRLDGPAVDWGDGYKEWWVQDEEVEPLFLVAYWLERGRCCWYDEEAQELRFGDV